MDFFHPSLLSMEHEAHADPNNLLHHFRQQSVAMDLDSFRDGIEASSCPPKLARTHSFCTTRRQHQPELKTNLDSAMSYAAGPYLHLYKSSGLHLNDEEAAEDQPPWPFTFSQFRELQQQALIFKYMMHGLPVPPHLIISIRHSLLESLASLPGNVGWRNYHHLSFAGNCADPEPGRCRRTDGKKWRCAREVVPNQKYCERHMHRGRHRAKKAAQIQAPSFLSTTTTSPSSLTTTPTISLGAHHAEDTTSSSSLSLKSLNATLSQTNLHHFPFKSAAKDDEKDHDYLNGDMHLGSSQMLSSTKQSGYNGEAEAMHKVEPLQFFDDWPRSRDAATTKLSMKSSDFSLKLSMCNGSAEEDALAAHEVGNVGIGGINEERQAKWIPIVWETSPLAEVLQSSSTLNLMTREESEHSPKHSSTMANSSSRGFLKNAASANSLSESGSGSI